MRIFFHQNIVGPIEAFIRDSRSVGMLLLGCTTISLLLANSAQWGLSYQHFWNDSFPHLANTCQIAGFAGLPGTPLELINEGLMGLFFYWQEWKSREKCLRVNWPLSSNPFCR